MRRRYGRRRSYGRWGRRRLFRRSRPYSRRIRLRSETKRLLIGAPGSIGGLQWISQGFLYVPTNGTQNGRIGNRVQLRGIKFNYVVAASASDGNNIVRMVIARPRATSAGVVAPGLYDKYDPDEWEVLFDKKWCLSLMAWVSGTQLGIQKRVFNKYIRINANLYYDDGESSSLQRPFYIHFLSDSAVLPSPTINGSCKVYYKDL